MQVVKNILAECYVDWFLYFFAYYFQSNHFEVKESLNQSDIHFVSQNLSYL